MNTDPDPHQLKSRIRTRIKSFWIRHTDLKYSIGQRRGDREEKRAGRKGIQPVINHAKGGRGLNQFTQIRPSKKTSSRPEIPGQAENLHNTVASGLHTGVDRDIPTVLRGGYRDIPTVHRGGQRHSYSTQGWIQTFLQYTGVDTDNPTVRRGG